VNPALDGYLEELLGVLRTALGRELVAVSLVGGAGAGAFEPGASDVDVAVVIERPVPADLLLELAAELSHQRRPVPARRLELVVYTRAGLAEGEFALNLNTGHDVERADLDPAAAESFWFVLDLAIARGRAPDPGVIDSALALRAEGRLSGLDPARVRELSARARRAVAAEG
jgi:hypothetical protein